MKSKYKIWAREYLEVKADGTEEVTQTIEFPLNEFIALIEKKAYNEGYSEGMLAVIQNDGE